MRVNRSAEKIRILVVDDEKDIRDGSERVLNRCGYRVETVSSGDRGLQAITAEPADIVLLDLKMPGMDGLEVLARIREAFPGTLVIIITGFATVDTAIEAMKRGAYDFIPKPFDPDQLRIVVARAVERLRLTREHERLAAERQRTLLDLDTEKSRLRTIIDFLPNGVMVTNAEGQVVLMNQAARQLLGFDPEEKLCRTVDGYLEDADLCRLVQDSSQGRFIDFEDIPAREWTTGSGKTLLVRGQPVLGERRECLGAVVNLLDITPFKALDQLKSDFVAKVSHELRSPLSTIHEQIAHVLNDFVGSAFKDDLHILSRAKEKIAGLISLISDLLDLSRIEEGAICRVPQPMDLAGLLEGVVEFMQARAAAKGQSLGLALPEGTVPPVLADPIGLESVFGNLIANAIHYTPEGGAIRVEVEPTGLNVRVRVRDNGFGIEEKHLDRIFDRFYRVKNEKTRYITGTGLGLPIVKGILDAIGGMITVESTPGKGSVFEVLLPLSGKAAGAPPPPS